MRHATSHHHLFTKTCYVLLLIFSCAYPTLQISSTDTNSGQLWQQRLLPGNKPSLSESGSENDKSDRKPDSIRDLIEAKTARKNFECRTDFCFNKLNEQKKPAVPVCATDGKTYNSKCMIKYLRRCHGQKVRVKHMGRCGFPVRDGGGRIARKRKPKCQDKRAEALQSSKEGGSVPFIPDCRKDGRFRRVQCNYQLKYCFCVRRKTGVPLSGTGVKLPNKPHCKKPKRGKKPKPQKDKKKNKRRCSSRQRAQFNINMLQQFEVEFNMTKSSRRAGLKPRRDLPITGVVVEEKSVWKPDRKAAEWKFSELDTNNDGSLSYRETKSLRRITRLNIKPRSCARRFFNACDINNNRKIERQEWIICFGLQLQAQDPNEEANAKPRPPPGRLPSGTNIYSDSATFTKSKGSVLMPPSQPQTNLPSNNRLNPPIVQKDPSSFLDLINKNEKRNQTRKSPFLQRSCHTARQDAIRKNEAQSNSKVFVPECTADGRFAKQQCYSSNPSDKLCFCMDPDTGTVLKPVNAGLQPGGSQFYLNCESANLQKKAELKEFRGCPTAKRVVFMKQFMDYLVQNTRDKWTVRDESLSVELRSISIKFAEFDLNKDGFLNKKERKTWRRDILKHWGNEKRKTKKCARHITSFCDADSNSELSLQEMILCLNIK